MRNNKLHKSNWYEFKLYFLQTIDGLIHQWPRIRYMHYIPGWKYEFCDPLEDIKKVDNAHLSFFCKLKRGNTYKKRKNHILAALKEQYEEDYLNSINIRVYNSLAKSRFFIKSFSDEHEYRKHIQSVSDDIEKVVEETIEYIASGNYDGFLDMLRESEK